MTANERLQPTFGGRGGSLVASVSFRGRAPRRRLKRGVRRRRMESQILETEELFRVVYWHNDYENQEVHSFMKQTYTEKPPFYFRVRNGGIYRNFTDVNSSSDDIQEIIRYFELCYDIDKREAKKSNSNSKIKEIAQYCADKTKEFLDNLRQVALQIECIA